MNVLAKVLERTQIEMYVIHLLVPHKNRHFFQKSFLSSSPGSSYLFIRAHRFYLRLRVVFFARLLAGWWFLARVKEMSYAYLLKYIIIGDTGKQLVVVFTVTRWSFWCASKSFKTRKDTTTTTTNNNNNNNVLFFLSSLLFRFCRRGQILPVVTIHR